MELRHAYPALDVLAQLDPKLVHFGVVKVRAVVSLWHHLHLVQNEIWENAR